MVENIWDKRMNINNALYHFSKMLRESRWCWTYFPWPVLEKNDREPDLTDFAIILIFRKLIKLNYLKWKRLWECLEMHNYIFIILIVSVYFAIACAESKYQNVCVFVVIYKVWSNSNNWVIAFAFCCFCDVSIV